MTTSIPTPEKQANFEALVALAQREYSAGRLAQAAEAYRAVIALRPNLAEAYNNLGSVLQGQGLLDEAAVQFERAATLKPQLFQAHNSLGDIFHAQGKLEQAVARYRQAIALRPDIAETYSNLGALLGQQGHYAAAAAHCERALALKPGLFQAHNNLGKIYTKQGKLDQAVARCRQAIALRPDYPEAYHNLGDALKQQGKLDEAAIQFERAVALKPALFQTHNNLGNLLRQQGKVEQAAARYEQAVAIKPDLAETHKNLGSVLKQQGEFERALASFEHSLALSPDNVDAHYNRATIKTFKASDPDLAVLEALAANPDRVPADKMMCVHFALGKALEDVGEHHRAFEQWILGNALQRREVEYDDAAWQRMTQLAANTFDASLLERYSGAGDPSTVPIFVLGMPRSGSTLVEQILASHPQVHGAGELQNLDSAVQNFEDASGWPQSFPASILNCEPDSLRRLGQAYLASLPPLAEGKTRITDKMPSNFLYIGLIRMILPNARIVHTMRDPVDVCVSCFARLFNDLPFAYDLTELGRHYRGYHKLMEHWRSVLPAGVMLDVVYEDVVDDLETQARRLIDYCGLPWDDRCLSFHETIRPITTSSNVQVRQPLYRTSVARWRRYEAFLQPLLAELEGCRPRE
ncbi:MAG TPA: tetratricopeptide repeat protein [Pirellulales bacterium]|jgi:tetratricopeptide (TPR) repeat protein|nr:tetratricopeptide repeat protein [Pirellulales bacterium]